MDDKIKRRGIMSAVGDAIKTVGANLTVRPSEPKYDAVAVAQGEVDRQKAAGRQRLAARGTTPEKVMADLEPKIKASGGMPRRGAMSPGPIRKL